jgi:hypothetical protein
MSFKKKKVAGFYGDASLAGGTAGGHVQEIL